MTDDKVVPKIILPGWDNQTLYNEKHITDLIETTLAGFGYTFDAGPSVEITLRPGERARFGRYRCDGENKEKLFYNIPGNYGKWDKPVMLMDRILSEVLDVEEDYVNHYKYADVEFSRYIALKFMQGAVRLGLVGEAIYGVYILDVIKTLPLKRIGVRRKRVAQERLERAQMIRCMQEGAKRWSN